MSPLLRYLFFLLLVRPLVLIVLGLKVRHRERLPAQGPAIIVANHNSHLDTLVLMTLFPLRRLAQLRPVAAQDYFFRSAWLKWFSLRVLGIIPLDRAVRHSHQHPLKAVCEALERGDILILFPEGSRGAPEQLGEFKAGIAHLARLHPTAPIYPIFVHGLGKSLPRGEALLVPFFCDVFIGEPFYFQADKAAFLQSLTRRMNQLATEGQFPAWD